jgi:hypothetical protein
MSVLLKNLFVFGTLIGGYAAVETGYFSNDRTSRSQWNTMEQLKAKGKPRVVYEADFSKDLLATGKSPEGFWTYYNGATRDTVAIADKALVLNYTTAWIGSEFRHTEFAAHGVYRVTVEAKVEQESAAILMRNRQLDLMREEIPVSGGDFKTYTYHYVAPGGAYDQVRVIFMPDNRQTPKGRMTVRKFRIEKLEG